MFCITKNILQKQPEERFLDYFIFLPFDGDINAALGSIILGGYVYIVKYILPNQETVDSRAHFSELLVTKAREDLGA